MATYPRLMKDAEFEQLISPECIGSGGARCVYGVQNDHSHVIKKVHFPFPGANFVEWFVCNAVAKTRWADAFGQCIALSESGRYLMMERQRFRGNSRARDASCARLGAGCLASKFR